MRSCITWCMHSAFPPSPTHASFGGGERSISSGTVAAASGDRRLLLVLPDGVHRYSAGLRHTWRQRRGIVVAARPYVHADLDTWAEAFGPNEPGQFQRGGSCYILLLSKGAPHSPGGDVRCISGDLQSLVFMSLDELYSWAAPLPGKASCQLETLQRLLQQS